MGHHDSAQVRVRLEAGNGDTVATGTLDADGIGEVSFLIYQGKNYRYQGTAGGSLHFVECDGKAWDVTELLT